MNAPCSNDRPSKTASQTNLSSLLAYLQVVIRSPRQPSAWLPRSRHALFSAKRNATNCPSPMKAVACLPAGDISWKRLILSRLTSTVENDITPRGGTDSSISGTFQTTHKHRYGPLGKSNVVQIISLRMMFTKALSDFRRERSAVHDDGQLLPSMLHTSFTVTHHHARMAFLNVSQVEIGTNLFCR